jgi:hypothetical protein
MYKETYMDINQ